MTCASCVARVEKALKAVPGVIDASVNLATEKATVRFAGGGAIEGALTAAVEKAGYSVRQRTEASAAQPTMADRKEAEARELTWSTAIAAILTLPLFVLEMGAQSV